jgi:hypothetical protein
MFIYLYFCYNLFDLVIFFATYVFGHKGEITVLEKELGHYNLILCLTSTFFQSEEILFKVFVYKRNIFIFRHNVPLQKMYKTIYYHFLYDIKLEKLVHVYIFKQMS